jgi:maltooligosyltrehalose trehalohydrolase
MIDIGEIGAFSTKQPDGSIHVKFGLYLPGITPAEGYQVIVRIIHNDDRFDPTILPENFDLVYQAGHPLDFWNRSIKIEQIPNTNFGNPGTYLYRYQLVQSLPAGTARRIVTLWFTDPAARATDIGELSAFTTPGFEPDFVWDDARYETPELDGLVVYELHVEEFNDTFAGIIERLTYLKSLGVNVLELMPVTSVKLDFDWGYGPLHYFAPNARWGGIRGLKNLVNECHKTGIAVILDVVYQHVDPAFPYSLVYTDAGKTSPMIGSNGPFGPQVDFSKPFAQDYFAAANAHWLNEYHVDGFRYDEVTDLFTGPTDTAYAKLAFDTYNRSLSIARFQGAGGYSRIIQVAEALGKAKAVLRDTFTSAAWQDELLNKVESMAHFKFVDEDFAHLLDPRFVGYPDTKTVRDLAGNPVDMPVAPFQYLETHDHSQLISFVAQTQDDPSDVPFGDRSKFFKLQPFAIALYTCQGVPMLWQGQEFAESWTLPPSGRRRISFRRDVHWEYFYDAPGSTLVDLYRRLGAARRQFRALRSRDSFYYNQQSNTAAGVVAYRRHAAATATQPEEIAMVFLNFSESQFQISVPFPKTGRYREVLDDKFRHARGEPSLEIAVANANDFRSLVVPSNYGMIFVTV